jgi:glycosyltransferase involved in cell wall biosynthesis
MNAAILRAPAMSLADVGVVVIGRNEGQRLRRCLESLQGLGVTVVYADSGSTDGSLELAASLGADAVALDPARPFTAARGRNLGFARLKQLRPDIAYVQFVDGDCEVIGGWLQHAKSFLLEHPRVACICGRLRERFPEQSVYNRLCDFEWNRAPGDTDSCGGIALMRTGVFEALGGFREDLPAGEEPELCGRMRLARWSIWRSAQPMAFHDAAILSFSQWWMRTRRGGFGMAQALGLAITDDRRSTLRQMLSAWTWALGWPLFTALAVVLWGAPGLLLLLAAPVQVLRIAARLAGPWRWRLERGAFLLLGKWPECAGQLQYLRRAPDGVPSFDYKAGAGTR